MSNWSTASKVLSTIQAGDTAEQVRSVNRSKILDAANCVPPLSEEDAKRLGVNINVNFGELAVLLTHAVTQMLSAFTSNQYFFTVSLPRAPKEKQADWGQAITSNINEIMMQSLPYYLLQFSRWSSVAKHGIGVMTWRHLDRWRPKFVALQDIRIATDTTLDFENLDWYAQRVPYTVSELVEEAFSTNPNNHWEKRKVANILKNYKEQNFTDATNNIDWETDYEKLASIVKQNGGFFGSNALPTIPLYHFYFKDGKSWKMRVVPDASVIRGGDDQSFLWSDDTSWGSTWQELIHCQFGDLSFDDPHTFGGVRGLGYMLLDATFYSNLTRCRFLQHVHDNFNILLRVTDPVEKARAAIQEFRNLGVIRSGVSIVPEQERHQINAAMVEAVMAMMKQLASEASSSYTQQADTGTQKEQTAFETRVKAEQVNAMTSGIILNGGKYEDQANREICRRFCLPNSSDPDVKLFRERTIAEGVPPQWLDVKQWTVQTVIPVGMGNPVIAQAAVEQLQKLAPKLSPQAQREINHLTVLVYTKDWRKAQRWAPIDKNETQSDATREAIGLFATLMIAAPGSVPPPQDNYIDQIEVLLPLLAGKITMFTQRNNMATPDEAMGLQNVLVYVSQAVQALAMDVAQAQRVKHYKDALAQLGNEIKGLAQRGQAAAEAQAKRAARGNGSEVIGKLRIQAAESQGRMALKRHETMNSIDLKNREFSAEQRRKDAESYAEIERGRFRELALAHNGGEKQ